MKFLITLFVLIPFSAQASCRSPVDPQHCRLMDSVVQHYGIFSDTEFTVGVLNLNTQEKDVERLKEVGAEICNNASFWVKVIYMKRPGSLFNTVVTC